MNNLTYCDACGYVVRGVFYNCKRCNSKNTSVYRDYFDKGLQAKFRKTKAGANASSTLQSLATVGLVVSLIVGAYVGVTSDNPEIKSARNQVLSAL